MTSNKPKLPTIIKLLAWFWIVGALYKLSLSYFSWPEFELWRSMFLLVIKIATFVSGVLLLRGLRQGAIIHFSALIINSVVFYSNPPAIEGIELYFTPMAIGLVIAIPLATLGIVVYYWKDLRWKNLS